MIQETYCCYQDKVVVKPKLVLNDNLGVYSQDDGNFSQDTGDDGVGFESGLLALDRNTTSCILNSCQS